MESYPYEPEERGSDYVRLASIAAGDWATSLSGRARAEAGGRVFETKHH